jgi:hypothetical protein
MQLQRKLFISHHQQLAGLVLLCYTAMIFMKPISNEIDSDMKRPRCIR